MTDLLLSAKLYMPPQRPNLLPRPRLIQTLVERLREGRQLTLVSAPAGYGQTTLLSDWHRDAVHSFTWLPLEEGDNDPVRFLRYIIAALQRIREDIGHEAQSLLGVPHIRGRPGGTRRRGFRWRPSNTRWRQATGARLGG